MFNAGEIAGELRLEIGQWTRSIKQASTDALTIGKTIDSSLSKSSKDASGSLTLAATSTRNFGSEAVRAAGDVMKLVNAEKSIGTKGVSSLSAGLRSLAGVAGTVSPQIGQLVSGFTAVESLAQGAGISMGKAAIGVGAIVAPLLAAKAAFNFTSQGVRLAADMEQTTIAFETIIGNASTARDTLEELKTFAAQTPFRFDDLANASRQLLAMGFKAWEVIPAMKRLGDVSSGLNQPLGEVAYLMGQIKSQGQAKTEDLNQFASRGIPIYRELAAVLKTTELGVRKLAEEGSIGFDQIDQAFIRMTSAGGTFFGMTERQSRSLKGQLSTLSDSWDAVARAAGEAFVGNDSVNDGIASLTKAVDGLVPAAQRFGEALRSAIEAAMPHLKSLIETASAGLDMVTGGDGKRIIKGSAQPATGAGLNLLKPEDAGRLLNATEALGNARDQLAAGFQNLEDLNKTNFGVKLSEKALSKDVAQRFQESMQQANVVRDPDAVNKVRDISLRVARGEAVSDEEWKAAVETATKLSEEVDRFRQNMTALQTELREKSELFERNPIQASAMLGIATPRGINDALSQSTATLDTLRPVLGRATNELAPVVNANAVKQRLLQASADAAMAGINDPIVKAAKEKKVSDEDRARSTRVTKEKQATDQVNEYQHAIQRATLELQGDEFGLQMLELDRRWKSRIDNAISEEERLTAQMAYEAEQRVAIAEDQKRREQGINTRGRSAATMGEALRDAFAVPTVRNRFGEVRMVPSMKGPGSESQGINTLPAQINQNGDSGGIKILPNVMGQEPEGRIQILPLDVNSKDGRGSIEAFGGMSNAIAANISDIRSAASRSITRQPTMISSFLPALESLNQSRRRSGGGSMADGQSVSGASPVNVQANIDGEQLATLIATKAGKAFQNIAESAAERVMERMEGRQSAIRYANRSRSGL